MQYWIAPLALLSLGLSACEKNPSVEGAEGIAPPASAASAAEGNEAREGAVRFGLSSGVREAKIGERAPDFVLPALDGRPVALSAHEGEVIVLEWFNPECPFVNLAHTKGSLKGMAARHQESGVVWIAVNSNAPGKQGHGVEKNRAGKKRFGLSHPILLDETGAVGKAYGAERTPHMFVIDRSFNLVYAGAIDNSPDAEGESPVDGKLVNFVDAALSDLTAKRPVATARTEAYGCSVKYGS